MKAVITGDIIQSTKLEPKARLELVRLIRSELKELAGEYKFKSEFFRGDSFQCYLTNTEQALRIALMIKTYIRSINPSASHILTRVNNPIKRKSVLLPLQIVDARVALGIGDAVLRNDLAISEGVAFELSGRLLDELKNRKQSFGIASDDMNNDELATEAILLDALLGKNTALQCEVINWKLNGFNETEIANKLNINQSAVNQRSRSGNWNAIEAMVNRFETIYNNK